MDPAGVFVYGSLLPGARHHALARRAGLVRRTPARLEGYRLYALPAGYPVAVPGTGAVEGELFEFRDLEAALRALDRFEDEGGLYRRVAVLVKTPAGMRRAWAYVADAAAARRRGGVPWPSGRWRGGRA